MTVLYPKADSINKKVFSKWVFILKHLSPILPAFYEIYSNFMNIVFLHINSTQMTEEKHTFIESQI